MTEPEVELEPTHVPDGAPCPKHGHPTRLLWLPYVGYISQCRGCIDDFFTWCAQQLRIRGSAVPTLAQSKPLQTPAAELLITAERKAAQSPVLDLFT